MCTPPSQSPVTLLLWSSRNIDNGACSFFSKWTTGAGAILSFGMMVTLSATNALITVSLFVVVFVFFYIIAPPKAWGDLTQVRLFLCYVCGPCVCVPCMYVCLLLILRRLRWGLFSSVILFVSTPPLQDTLPLSSLRCVSHTLPFQHLYNSYAHPHDMIRRCSTTKGASSCFVSTPGRTTSSSGGRRSSASSATAPRSTPRASTSLPSVPSYRVDGSLLRWFGGLGHRNQAFLCGSVVSAPIAACLLERML